MPWLDAALMGLLGLLVGSFLNVVIHRLPRMMEMRWAAECAELQRGKADPMADDGPGEADTPAFNLMVPRSRCPHCGHQIRWYENVPVLSYLALRGRCSQCAAPISPRYPMVELVCGALFAWCGWQ
nr:prepilin peptidase [Hydrogenophaga sp.]